MRRTLDDATLTAYALGELSEGKRREVEESLNESGELRRELDQIRATVAVLRQALAAEPRLELSGPQRAAIEAEARRAPVVRFPLGRPLSRPAAVAAAASLLLAILAYFLLSRSAPPEPAPVVADSGRRPTPPPAAVPAPFPAATPARTPSPVRERCLPVSPTPALQLAAPVAPLAAPAPAAAEISPSPTPPPIESAPRVATAGTVRGTVVDETGAVIPNASVTLTNESSGEVFPTFTDGRGVYLVAGLPPGAYSVRSTVAGFKTVDLRPITVVAGEWTVPPSVELPVAAVAETIEVTTEPALIQTSSGTIAHVGRSRFRPKKNKKDARAAPSNEWVAELKVASRPDGVDLDRLRVPSAEFTTEAYDHIRDNPFVLVSQDPRSTFSIDVDTASYSIVRRFLNGGSLPPKDAVRIEELINYFRYDDEPPAGPHPFAVHMETATCPWKPAHRLVRIGLKGRELPRDQRPPANLVFLLDVSGSMQAPNKLPLVQSAMKLLVEELGVGDRVAIVVYAGAEGLALPSTPATEKATILGVLDRLSAGGTTHGSAGIRLAYEIASAHFIKGGVNRVILATDGDFNVGITNQGELIRLIEEQAKSGVFLTALGFGLGNLKDSTLEKLADRGNGNYAYIDGLWEARKVLVEQMSSTLVTIAKDVKLQIEFNPSAVKAFRLIGYENRVLAHRDFGDDKKDAGEIGAGHTVTALYEIVPPGGEIEVPGVDPLKYQEPARPRAHAESGELLTLKLRYKLPEGDQSTLMEVALDAEDRSFDDASSDLRFAAAVASFGMLLRDSPYRGDADLDRTLRWAKASLGADEGRLRAELVTLVEKARGLSRPR